MSRYDLGLMKEEKLHKGMPNLKLVTAYCKSLDLPESDALAIYEQWIKNRYRTREGPILHWKACIRTMKANKWVQSLKEPEPPGLVEHRKIKASILLEASEDRLNRPYVAEEERARIKAGFKACLSQLRGR